MPIRRPLAMALVLAVLSVGLALAGTGRASAAVTRVDTTTDTRCGFLTYRTPTSWYFPAGTPRALVWVQHGFSRSKDRMDDLARRYAGAGYLAVTTTLPSADLFGCTVQNLANNTGYLNNVADLFGKKDAPDKLARSLAVARTLAARPDVAMPKALLLTGHSAGGEAVAYIANRLRVVYPTAYTDLRGVILLDPVPSAAGSNLRTGLTGLSGSKPVLTISAPPSSCNGYGAGTTAVTSLVTQAFVGVRLTTGTHTDAEGASTNGLGTLVCGSPTASNASSLQTLSIAWADDIVTDGRLDRPDVPVSAPRVLLSGTP